LVSLHGDSEHVPPLLEVVDDKVFVEVVAPPPPSGVVSDDPTAQAAPASTNAPMVGSKRDRMAHIALRERTLTANEVNDW
jgi:hypothetical protein